MDMTGQNRQSERTMLSQKQFDEISDCLSELARKLRVTALLLIDNSGRIVAKHLLGQWNVDATLMAVLTASTHAASREMARLLHERANFKMVLYEGEDHNTYISAAGENTFLVVVFESSVALGMVRLFTKRTIAQLMPVLNRHDAPSVEMDQIFDHRFQTLLDDELDRSFKEIG